MSVHFLPRTVQLGYAPTDRRAIEEQIEMLIELLDQVDGDPDEEPDHEDYDACDLGEPLGHFSMLPRYGIDQSRGPTNSAAVLAHHMRMTDS